MKITTAFKEFESLSEARRFCRDNGITEQALKCRNGVWVLEFTWETK